MTAQGMTDGRIMDALTPVSKAKFAKRIAEDRIAAMSSSNKKPKTIMVTAGNCEASRLTQDKNMIEIEDEDTDETGAASNKSNSSSEGFERACDGQDADENHAQYMQEEADNLEVQENLRRYLEEDYDGTKG